MNDQAVADRVLLTLSSDGCLRGSAIARLMPDSVTIHCDGVQWATIPSRPIAGSTDRSFRCDLPPAPVGWTGRRKAVMSDAFGDEIASLWFWDIPDRDNARGIKASHIKSVHDRPFYAVSYITFDGASITIVGAHLPPAGDPGALSVAFGPGVSFDFNYPIDSNWQSHFWYWPNAIFSDFQLVINLAASDPGSDPFTFRFLYDKGPQKDLPEPYGRVWIPRDLAACIGFPKDNTQLTRVQTWSDPRSVTLTGYNNFRTIEALFARYGIGPKGTTVMDWGCGHGRVTRHFVREWRDATIIGMDVDAENAEWADGNLAPGQFVTSPLFPPCDLPDDCLDALFSISVMTHLPVDVQRSWLTELARLMKPGAIALMSFGGPSAVAWSSVWHDTAYVDQWTRDGIHSDLVDGALDGKISDATYYRNTAQTHHHVREHWSDHFEILDILPEAIGNLDFAVLRRR
jgi:cyclopropane fatty-acyl-phospholipid synthase-like methyltransferase